MRKQILSLLVVLLIGSTVCMAQDRQKGKVDREKRIEQIITDLGPVSYTHLTLPTKA